MPKALPQKDLTRTLKLASDITLNDVLCGIPKKKGDHRITALVITPFRVTVTFADGDTKKMKQDAFVYVRRRT